MIDVKLAAPFLKATSRPAASSLRLTALETLIHLPVSDGVREAMGDAAGLLLSDLEPETTPLDPYAIDILARIPRQEVRRQLEKIAIEVARPDSLVCAMSLARNGSAVAVQRLLGESSPRASVAQLLATQPLDRLRAANKMFETGLKSEDPDTHFWSAIGLARFGRIDALEEIWRSLLSGDAKAPSLFHGDPWTAYAALKRARPIPEGVRKRLVELYERGLWNALTGQVPRDAYLLIGGLTGIVDPEGRPVEGQASPAEIQIVTDRVELKKVTKRLMKQPFIEMRLNASGKDRAALQSLHGKEAGLLMVKGLRVLGHEAKVAHRPEEMLNNAVAELASALPPAIEMPIADLMEDPILEALPRRAVIKAFARTSPEHLVGEIGPRIDRVKPAERERLLKWTRDIAVNLGVPPQYEGAGGFQPEDIELGDDLSTLSGLGTKGAGSHGHGSGAGAFSLRRSSASIGDARPASDLPVEEEEEEEEAAAPSIVYPDISVPDEHPVGGQRLKVQVSLSVAQTAGTVGAVRVGPATEVTLDVHLSIGAYSAWDTLVYKPKEGKTTKKAEFDVALPEVNGGEPMPAQLRASFYLNKRWCGEGLRNLDLRKSASIPAKDVPEPKVSEYCRNLILDPHAEPPDLTVHIRSDGTDAYTWSCISPHVAFPPARPEDAQRRLGKDADTFVRNLFEPQANVALDDDTIRNINGICESIYSSAPPIFRTAYWMVHKAMKDAGLKFETIQFVTDEPRIPWELMRVATDQRGPDLKAEILAVRHSVGRWVFLESSRMPQTIGVRRIAVSASGYDGIAGWSPLPSALEEKKFLVADFKATPIDLKRTPVITFLETGGAQAVHFACHGEMKFSSPQESSLILEDTPRDLKVPTVRRSEVRDGLGKDSPLVFLNACEAGAGAPSLSLVSGFPEAFIYAGAAAVVSPLWIVNDTMAKEVCKQFYESAFRGGGTLGEVMRTIRTQWTSEKHLTYLAYVLYGDPKAKLRYAPN